MTALVAKPSFAKGVITPDQGVKELWTFGDYIFPDARLNIKSLTSNKELLKHDIGHLNDDLVKLVVLNKSGGAAWANEGAPLEITLDMGKVVDITDIRLPTVVKDSYVRKNYYQPGEMKFKLVCSDDNFGKDLRELTPEVKEEVFTYPKAQYTYAGRIPMYVLPMNQAARYVRIIPETTNDFIVFQKLIVNGKRKNKIRKGAACE